MSRRADGTQAVVVKRAVAAGRDGLRREAEVLRAARGPDVVVLVELDDGPESTELVLRDTGGPPLAGALSAPSTGPRAGVELLAAACRTVARFHAGGWAHGRISTDHVVLTARGRMRLCSLRSAAPIAVDPDLARADRAALLRMVDDWCRAAAGRRGLAWFPTRCAAASVTRRTARLPDDPDPLVLARVLDRSVRFGAGRPRPEIGAEPTASPERGDRGLPGRLRRGAVWAMPIGVLVLIACTVLGVDDRRVGTDTGSASGTGTQSATQPTAVGSGPASTPVGTTPSTTEATTVPMSAPTSASVSMPPATTVTATCSVGGDVQASPGQPDADGDGCADDVRTLDGAVEVDGRRYRVGSPGDVVAIGDWDCDGVATVAVLRPSTGDVHVFDSWATSGTAASARRLATVAGATGIAADPATCGPPIVRTADGATFRPTGDRT